MRRADAIDDAPRRGLAEGEHQRSVYGQDRPLIASEAATSPDGWSAPRNSVSTKTRSFGLLAPARRIDDERTCQRDVHVSEPKPSACPDVLPR
jgi:hypothetical protein